MTIINRVLAYLLVSSLLFSNMPQVYAKAYVMNTWKEETDNNVCDEMIN